jgi:hypothetical protein
MIFEIFSPNNGGGKSAFLTQDTAMKFKLKHWFVRKTPFFAKNMPILTLTKYPILCDYFQKNI